MDSVLTQADPSSRPVPLRAVAYVRMSTEHQQYSIRYQTAAIRAYAEARGISVVRTYADEGRSGLRVDNRGALNRLIRDVHSGRPDFSMILVFDISRWGRFQDTDESAYYEFICRRAGIRVEYCAEQFENDGSAISTVVKGLKRVMAGEYSRDLSAKVFASKRVHVQGGFCAGSIPPYGMRRLLVSSDRQPKLVLEAGDRKSLQTDRVLLVPGPPEEVAAVRWIFETYIGGAGDTGIARTLNARNVPPADRGQPWKVARIAKLLKNEVYIGTIIWNRTNKKLGGPQRPNPPASWVRIENAFEPIIDRTVFEAAQRIRKERRERRPTDEFLLDGLRRLRRMHGKVTQRLVDQDPTLPSIKTYQARFGSLTAACELIGYRSHYAPQTLLITRRLRRLCRSAVQEILSEIAAVGSQGRVGPTPDVIQVNGEFTVQVQALRCRQSKTGAPYWYIVQDRDINPDLTIGMRMDPANKIVRDYFQFPKDAFPTSRLRLFETNGAMIDVHRSESLQLLYEMARRRHVGEGLI